MTIRNIIIIICFCLYLSGKTQEDINIRLHALESELMEVQKNELKIKNEIEEIKLKLIISDIKRIGLPAMQDGEMVVYHCGFAFCYLEEHEQSKWVVHIILPDIATGNVSRTNDFKEDTLVRTGTATIDDYWNSGFDRGHLAPSADFRWSPRALGESYYYSNMAPQRPVLNREKWAEMEDKIRQYVVSASEQVYIVTGGILKQGLPVMQPEGKITNVSIPEYFYKVVLDYEGDDKKGIGFIMPNSKCEYPVWSYACTIDSVEEVTGIDFFISIPDFEENIIESTLNIQKWQAGSEKGEAPPIKQQDLPRKAFNTIQAKSFIGDKITVCGTVVSTKYHEKTGATFINLDKKFPNQIFTLTIWKNNRVNFSYVPENELLGKRICVKGDVKEYKGVPTIDVENEKQIIFMDEDNDF
ncbi:MAG: DNA/RNA non-specific endonuclease [Bacteroidia bacterium]|nr:DNA/RNA non-specific endonuclease [Bacteroidia bacterium]